MDQQTSDDPTTSRNTPTSNSDRGDQLQRADVHDVLSRSRAVGEGGSPSRTGQKPTASAISSPATASLGAWRSMRQAALRLGAAPSTT